CVRYGYGNNFDYW
nr:immunoglobulin heavy chain junction region [Macaca mulatta]